MTDMVHYIVCVCERQRQKEREIIVHASTKSICVNLSVWLNICVLQMLPKLLLSDWLLPTQAQHAPCWHCDICIKRGGEVIKEERLE